VLRINELVEIAKRVPRSLGLRKAWNRLDIREIAELASTMLLGARKKNGKHFGSYEKRVYKLSSSISLEWLLGARHPEEKGAKTFSLSLMLPRE
jgi:hypothetical protein